MKAVRIGTQGSDARVTVFLHGFPGLRSKQNLEIAEAVAASTGEKTFIVYYSGLTQSPGEFGFERCMKDVTSWFEDVSRDWREVDLVGHSWGGFLSLVIASRWPEKIRKMVLMSPLLKFADVSIAEPSFAQTARENPALTLPASLALAEDFVHLGQANDTSLLAGRVSAQTEILFLQAREDAITPPEYAQALVAKFQRAPHFELADNDHSFLSRRPELAAQISQFLI